MPNSLHSQTETICNVHRSQPRKALLSLVIPAFNEELNLEKLYDVLVGILEQLDSYTWEMIIVDDGSRDQTRATLEELHSLDNRVKMISFSRNFGHQMAISAGLEAAAGDAVIVMDGDLQHPPELIPELLARWEQGYHVVNMRRSYGNEISWFKRKSSDAFYRVMDMLSEVHIERGGSDFRLMDRKVVNVLNNMPEHARFIRAQVAWLGFRQTTIPYTANKRCAGVPSFSLKKMVLLAIDGIISSSVLPLRLITFCGIGLFATLIPYGMWALFEFCFLGSTTPGWTSLVMIELIVGGAMLVSLGIIGEYIARIYEEVKHRPRYIVERSLGFSRDDHTEQIDQSPVSSEIIPFSDGESKKTA